MLPTAILDPSGFQHDDRTIHSEPQADRGTVPGREFDSRRRLVPLACGVARSVPALSGAGERAGALGGDVRGDGAADRGIRARPVLADQSCPLAVVTHPGHQVFQAASDWRTSATG